MNILLTGASGFLGKIILNYLKLQNVNVLTIGRRSPNHIVCDLSSSIPIINSTPIDLIVHVAGKAHSVPMINEDKQVFFNVNLRGTDNLLKGLEKSTNLPKAFVFISSVAVYGISTGTKIPENRPLLANDPYGISKIQAERLVLEWCQKNKVICTILRLPLLVGDNPPGNLGEMINGIIKGYYFNIAGGTARKSMVLAEDVAKILIKASKTGGIYNLTDGINPSFYELSYAIAKTNGKIRIFNMPFFIAKSIAIVGDLVGLKLPLNSSKLKKITTDLTFDDTKARRVLGWNPEKVLDYYIR